MCPSQILQHLVQENHQVWHNPFYRYRVKIIIILICAIYLRCKSHYQVEQDSLMCILSVEQCFKMVVEYTLFI